MQHQFLSYNPHQFSAAGYLINAPRPTEIGTRISSARDDWRFDLQRIM